MKMKRSNMGKLMTLASMIRSLRISSTVDCLSMKKPGIEAPAVTEMIEATTPSIDIPPDSFAPNQLMATLLGVFSRKIFPNAANVVPNRQKVGSPTFSKTLTHAPAVTRMAPALKQMLIPTLARMKFQGKARIGCVMVKMSALRVTVTDE